MRIKIGNHYYTARHISIMSLPDVFYVDETELAFLRQEGYFRKPSLSNRDEWSKYEENPETGKKEYWRLVTDSQPELLVTTDGNTRIFKVRVLWKG